MALYGPELFWYTDESLASNTQAHVFPRNSNVHASIFSDAAMTVPLANPTTTDGSGYLTFYAAPGDYWVQIEGLAFDFTVNDGSDESWHTTYVHHQVVAATVWSIPHMMNTQPDVSIRNAAGDTLQFANVTYPDLNNTTITFNSPQTGYADLRR